MSPMNTTNVTLKTQNEIGGCRTQHEANMKRDFHLEIYTSKSLLVIISTEIKKINRHVFVKHGCPRRQQSRKYGKNI